MSYARFGCSDIYVFMHVHGHLACMWCALTDKTMKFNSTQGMVDHLHEHITAGHDVPDDVIPELWADDVENFPEAAQ